MRCPGCGHENRPELNFCTDCGAKLELGCPSCGAQSQPGERFCGRCGQTLTEPARDAEPAQPAPALSEQPTSFADGRYRVKEFLGEGGKKKVFLAHDTLLDRNVAFGLIKTEGLDEAGRTRISRETQAMGRLGSHPHIVTVFDLGDHEGQPYMVSGLMHGGDVEGIIDSAPDHRVHRDLKPSNVWLTADGTAKIGDFGLAVATDRSRLTQAGMMVGTVSYMPPEQAMGGEVTGKADLYSLGAMLYEIIGQHINTPPVAPTWHNSSCPKPLEALILRLLAEDPAERPESASDVLTALEGVDLSAGVEEPSKDGDDANVLDSLAGGVFVGRQREMGELKAALEDALSGRGRLVTLVGEPGIGKTRTARELATYAGLRGAQVLWGRCYEEQGVPSYWPWVQAIRSYVREREPEQLRSEMGAGAADIAEIVSDVRERLPDLEQPPAQESPEQARCRLFDSITTFLKSASDSRPLVLMLDDLHWADKPSLLLLEFVARELAGARLLLIGTYRDMELSRQHPLAETLGELTRERLFQRILLRGLTQEDVSRFIEATSGITPPQGLVESVYQQTEGNPLFVTEVVLHAQIAQTLEELYGEEAEAHAAELVHHLAQAETVLGSEKLVRYSLLAGERALTVYGYEEALGHFQRALAARGDGVESQPAADAETAAILFGIGQVQLATPPLHQWGDATANLRRAFDFYAESGDVARAVAVATHLTAFTRGGHQAAATELISRALKLAPDDSSEAAYLLSRYAGVLGLGQGDYEGAQKAVDRALEIARREGDAGLEMATLAIASGVEGYHLRLHRTVDRSLEAVALEQVDDLLHQGLARLWGGLAQAAMGKLDEARLSMDACLRSYEKSRDRYRLALGLGIRGWLSMLEGDWESARDFIDRGLSLAPQETVVLGTGAMLEFETGDFERGETYLERMLDIVRLSPPGPSVEYGFTSMWLAMAARISGVDERLGVAEEAAGAVLSSPLATRFMARPARVGMALIAVQRGDVDAASEQYAALGPQRGIIMFDLVTDRLLGLLAQTMGKLDDAMAHFEDALTFRRKAGYRPELTWTCCDYADTLLQREGDGDREKAMSLLDESLAISTELGMRPLMKRVLPRREILRA